MSSKEKNPGLEIGLGFGHTGHWYWYWYLYRRYHSHRTNRKCMKWTHARCGLLESVSPVEGILHRRRRGGGDPC